MNNLFIVGTPSHYLNLLECIEKFDLKTTNSDLIFLNDNYSSSDQLTEDFIKNYIDVKRWKSVNRITLWDSVTKKIYSIDNIKKICSLIFHILTKNFVKKYDHLVVSQVDQFYSQLFYFFVSAKKVISLDEGNAIFKILQRINSRRFRWPIPSKIIFFSSYDIEVPNGDTLVICNYNFSKKKLKETRIVSSDVWFIGSPYLEDKLVDKELYWQSIEKIRKDFQFKKINYFPHRRESEENLKILQRVHQFSIMRIDCPIELFLLQNNQLPSIISGFSSAALMNLQKITKKDIEIHSYFINTDDKPSDEFIKNQYLDQGITVIDL
tara:strand:+ start:11696 stop:12664 length:969 start_codon:yes stop_codon:yes gene_type:complete